VTRYADLMAEAMAEFRQRVPTPKPRKPGKLRCRRPWIAKTCACGRSAWNRTRQCEACYFREYRRRGRAGDGVQNEDVGMLRQPDRRVIRVPRTSLPQSIPNDHDA
jgi:hypothetical protein